MENEIPVVAVVDDDSAVLKALTRLLRSTGWAVLAFNSSQALLDRLPGLRFDCLILDVQMPGMSGFELKQRLGQLGCRAPVLFITAHDSPQSRATASQTGSLGLLIKPFSSSALLTALSLRSLVPPAGPPEVGGQASCPA
jgi:FixJ family two-component response regulator